MTIKRKKKKKWQDSYKVKIQPPKDGYYSFDEAKKRIQETTVMSVIDYTRWYLLNHPARMPRRPDRTYLNKGFTTWSDFLGSNNSFGNGRETVLRRNYLSYEEAKSIVHSYGLKTQREWAAFCRSKKRPENIPHNPNIYYRRSGEWFTWMEWLGTDKKTAKIETLQKYKKVVLITKPESVPSNVYHIEQITAPVFEIISFVKNKKVVKIYSTTEFDWQNFIGQRYRSYYGEEGLYVIPNINELIFTFDSYLDSYSLPS